MDRAKSVTLLMVTAVLLLTSIHVAADITGRVVAVTDGDTITVLDATNTQHKVRLIGSHKKPILIGL